MWRSYPMTTFICNFLCCPSSCSVVDWKLANVTLFWDVLLVFSVWCSCSWVIRLYPGGSAKWLSCAVLELGFPDARSLRCLLQITAKTNTHSLLIRICLHSNLDELTNVYMKFVLPRDTCMARGTLIMSVLKQVHWLQFRWTVWEILFWMVVEEQTEHRCAVLSWCPVLTLTCVFFKHSLSH